MNHLARKTFPWLYVFGLLLTSTPGAAADQPNLLLIVSEDNGPELGCYGDRYARTPNLDRLAGEGVLFENAFVPYSVCSPSRAAYLTGLFPHQNGQIGLATHRFAMYREDTPNIVTLLKSAGYQTGLIGKLHVNPESAFPFDFHAIPGANFRRQHSVEDYAAAAARFLTEAADRPFFLSVNFPDAHLPFLRQANGRPTQPQQAEDVKPMPWVGVDSPRLRQQVADYYNCLARLDDGVGLLLNELERAGCAERTIVFYLSDHGAQFPRGKGTVYEGGLRVPLILRWPGHVKAGLVRKELVSTIDILPTVLQAAGVKSVPELPGRPLQALLDDQVSSPWREYIFAFTTGSFPRACFVQHSIRDARFKLISSPRPGTENLDAATYLDPAHPHFVVSGATPEEQNAAPSHVRAALRRWSSPPRYELYDLQRDPNQWHNLADDPQHAQTKLRLIAALEDWQRRTRDPFLDLRNVNAFVEEQLANRDLGYRKQSKFRWSYLTSFPQWRERFNPSISAKTGADRAGDRSDLPAMFRAGAAAVDITPKPGVSLDGPISKNGPVTGVHDPLHARAIVLDDGATRLAIVICDACIIGRDVFDAAKSIVQETSGLPVNRMLMAATHTHAAVRAVHIGTGPLDDEYHRFLARRIADAVLQAEKNLAPAQIGFGSFDKPEFIGCRRLLCQAGSVDVNPFGETGERIKSVAGRSSAIIKPAGPVDPQVSIVSIQHADGKPLAVLANFSVHYCGGYQRGLVSADYFGHYAAALQSELHAGDGRPPFVGVMSNGTSGNTGAIQTGGKRYAPFEWMKVSARILAEDTLRVIRTIPYRSEGSLAMHESELELAVRRPDEQRLAWARAVLADPAGPQPHRWSKVYAEEALHLSKYPPTVKIKLQAVRIGELAIVAIPCEVFAETGLAIKQQSPYAATFTIELANGYGGYLPPPEQHALGGYETWPARSSFLDVQAEPTIRVEALRLLGEVRSAVRD